MIMIDLIEFAFKRYHRYMSQESVYGNFHGTSVSTRSISIGVNPARTSHLSAIVATGAHIEGTADVDLPRHLIIITTTKAREDLKHF